MAGRFIELELAENTDRGAAIIGGSYVEEHLKEALLRFLQTDKKGKEWFFSPNGPLASFEGKIRMAYASGMIDAEFQRDLLLIKRIRNDFAHKLGLPGFEAPSIADRLRELCLLTLQSQIHAGAKREEMPPRERYLTAIDEACELLSRRFPGISSAALP